MNTLKSMVWVELKKASRSVMPLSTAIIILFIPLACGLMMLIYKDPVFAREAGIISVKAHWMGGTADWPSYMNMLSLAVGIAGMLLFSLVQTWIFGREFMDKTMKDLMAVPVNRSIIVLAKFIVSLIWSVGLTLEMYLVSMLVGALIGLPGGTSNVLIDGSITILITAILVMGVVTPAAYFASIGRGYFPGFGFAIISLAIANILALMGWGHLFPWSIPLLFADTAKRSTDIIPISYLIIIFTAVLGVFMTIRWWLTADQHR